MTALLEVDRISKSFRALRAVTALRFSVAQGEILGMIGPNGAGKTTAVNLVSGTIVPDTGRVRFGGEDITGKPTHALVARGLVRTFQSTTIYGNRTVWQNVLRGAFSRGYKGFWSTMIGSPAHRDAMRSASGDAERLLGELGLRECRDDLAGSLPYGRQKALGLAIALASGPRMILLDEPAAGLSSEEADRVADVIKEINGNGVTVMVIDHNMRFISRLCDRVVVLHHGTELCVGTPADVIRNPQVIEAYLGSEHEPA
ncbi:ABC transporter ATP-binding protein [Bradyrhizobium sp. NP1]|uniref:ABC transporter ATP-binding protein n=1 Tax=Bradyrhizobium sp. NP1 TaxID=3049772 RepID=UPI0025A4D0BA|nr:ABC transporter ATP-binding protein [Bradyrhizobium sp. NP1]WJR79156.1 ABC transporter ATP-binding protein [Bradyrhizobium sp. NP1]